MPLLIYLVAKNNIAIINFRAKEGVGILPVTSSADWLTKLTDREYRCTETKEEKRTRGVPRGLRPYGKVKLILTALSNFVLFLETIILKKISLLRNWRQYGSPIVTHVNLLLLSIKTLPYAWHIMWNGRKRSIFVFRSALPAPCHFNFMTLCTLRWLNHKIPIE